MGRKPFTVTRVNETVVRPAPFTLQESPGGLYYLSNFDLTFKVPIPTVYCYKSPSAGAGADAASGGSVAAKLKEALEKVLVYYYPLAAQIVKDSDGRLALDCRSIGDHGGALFVEAEADGDVEDVGDLLEPDPTMLGMLVSPNIMRAADEEAFIALPSLGVQVTKFRCGGFVLGLSISHMLVDGIAAMEFLKSWAETARGLQITTVPFLDRTILKPRSPLAVEFRHPELEPPPAAAAAGNEYSKNLTRSFLFSVDQLDEFKSKISAHEVGGDDTYTSFEALAGLVWRSWAAALGLGRRDCHEEDLCRLMFSVNARGRFAPPLPTGFMGNAFVVTSAACRAAELVDRPPIFAAGLVREAVRKVTDAYLHSSIDYLEATGSRGPTVHIGSTQTLFILAWSRLEFHRHDFGWGEPAYIAPAVVPSGTVTYFLPGRPSPGGGRRGVQVMVALPEEAMEAFQEHIKENA